jgi:hypothetical protein
VPTIRVITKAEAQQTRTPKQPGVRRQRMDEFDLYVLPLIESSDQAVVYEGIEEVPQNFVLSLRWAFKRAGLDVSVRKMRGRNEVRAWVNEPKPAPVPALKPAAKRASGPPRKTA